MSNLPPMTDVQSSNVEAIGYDESASELFVRFKGGNTYAFSGVPAYKYQQALAASSVGKFVYSKIKSNFSVRIHN
jgi:KTSC domain